MSRLLVLGDLHCDRRHLRGLVERAVEERWDTLVSLGDLCYLPRDPEGRLRCLAYGGALPVRSPRAGRDWHRAAARERAALKYLAGGDEIDLLFCHDRARSSQARGHAAPSPRSPRSSAPPSSSTRTSIART